MDVMFLYSIESIVKHMSQKNENRRERFVRLANYRINEAINIIRKIGNLSNKSLYEYDDTDVNKMFSTIDKKMKESRYRFASKEKKHYKII